MSTAELWIAIIGMGVITYGIRLLPIALQDKLPLTARVRQALRYVPVAVLTAIVVPELLLPGGVWDFSLGNGRLLAGVLAIGIAWRTKNVLLTIGAGMAALWLLQIVMASLS